MRQTRIALLTLITASLGCSGGEKRALFLDREYASLCDAFEAIGNFSLSLHIEKVPADFDGIRKKTAARLAEEWGEPVPSEGTEKCADLKKLGDAKGVSGADLYRKAAEVFVSQLDPHSAYLPPKKAEAFNRSVKNQFEGIGVTLRSRLADAWIPPEKVVIDEVFPGSPAWNLLHPGDRIVAVDGKPVDGMLVKEVMQAIAQKNPVSLNIEGESETVTLKPAPYIFRPVMWRAVERDGTTAGYIKIRTFNEGTAKLFEQALDELAAAGAAGLLIDLRGNGGGLLDEAVRIVDALLDRGVVFTTRGHPGKRFPADPALNPVSVGRATVKGEKTDLPVAVLVDQSTASASEVVAGAVGESGRGLVVGDRTFGKGTGQKFFPLSDKNGLGGEIALAMFRYYLGDGYSPQKEGIVVHVRVPDPALARAEAELKAKGEPMRLTEEDYGENVVSSAGGKAASPPSGDLLRWIEEIKLQTNGGADLCGETTDDCQKEYALSFLKTAAELQPRWPSTPAGGIESP